MQEIHWLSEKVTVLLRRYNGLQAENLSLKQALERQKEQMKGLQAELRAAEERMLAVEIAGMLPEGAERDRVRKQLDQVILEIDKILNTLND